MSEQSLLKILLIGDSGVGKTSIILRFADGDFFEKPSTVGVDFKVKQLQVGEHNLKLQLWDTAGQERFRTMTTSYFRGAHGILLTYSMTDEASFESIDHWYDEINCHAEKYAQVMLIANKSDLQNSRTISEEKGKILADKLGSVGYFEVSAKEDSNLHQAMSALCKKILDSTSARGNSNNQNTISINNPTKTSKGCAC